MKVATTKKHMGRQKETGRHSFGQPVLTETTKETGANIGKRVNLEGLDFMIEDIYTFAAQRARFLKEKFANKYTRDQRIAKAFTDTNKQIDKLLELRLELELRGLGSLEDNFMKVKKKLPELRKADRDAGNRKTDLKLIINELEKLVI